MSLEQLIEDAKEGLRLYPSLHIEEELFLAMRSGKVCVCAVGAAYVKDNGIPDLTEGDDYQFNFLRWAESHYDMPGDVVDGFVDGFDGVNGFFNSLMMNGVPEEHAQYAKGYVAGESTREILQSMEK